MFTDLALEQGGGQNVSGENTHSRKFVFAQITVVILSSTPNSKIPPRTAPVYHLIPVKNPIFQTAGKTTSITTLCRADLPLNG